MDGWLAEIWFAPKAGAEMETVPRIRAIAGRGLEGDRYERGAGTYSKFPGAHDVTLFETEALWDFERFSGVALHPSQTRRNLIMEGVKLPELIGVEFTIGPVRLLGLRDCPPCLYLSQMLKLPILLKGLARSGGIYAQILNDGVLSVGDGLERLPKTSADRNNVTSSSMSVIQKAKREDARQLAELAEETFRETFGAVNTVENMDLHCQASYGESIQAGEISDPNLVTLLSKDGEKLVGFAQLRWGGTPSCIRASSPGEIQRLYVASGWHGRGVAQDLMKACIEEISDRGSDVVWLGVWEGNARAIAFYRKFGFVEVGDHIFPLGNDPQRDIVMVRTVAGAPSGS